MDPHTIIGLCKLIATMRPAACICNSSHDANNLAIAARIFGRHRPLLARSKAYVAGKISAHSYNHLVDFSFTPSKYLKDKILSNKRINPERVEVIYTGVDFGKLDVECTLELPSDITQWTVERILVVHDAQLAAIPWHRYLDAWQRLQHYIVGGKRSPIATVVGT
ncbi:hypothetical protein ACPUER_29435 [Burkholderia sp. DN3021]|uniref:hypothetical protein n=1 Tax=Burkholderia sp. DN3021 TaxID=3410137 RepID=UPI003C7C34DF